MAEMNAALRAEGQRTLIIGDREYIANDNSNAAGLAVRRFANAVTSNENGSLGYQLEGDRPRNETSNRMCVGAKFINIRIFDAHVAGTPAAARLGGLFDQLLAANERRATRPMVIADTVHPNGDGTYRRGMIFSLLGNTRLGAAFAFAVSRDGRYEEHFQMGNVEYTQAARDKLNR